MQINGLRMGKKKKVMYYVICNVIKITFYDRNNIIKTDL